MADQLLGTANGASWGSRDIDHTTRGARVRERDALESIRLLADRLSVASRVSTPAICRLNKKTRLSLSLLASAPTVVAD